MSNPRDLRRTRILDVARRLFSRHGYENTSLSMIIEKTGGSRRDFYEFFGNKEGLLRAVLGATMGDVLRCADLLHADPDAAPEEVLHRFGMEFLRRMLKPDVVSAFREFAAVGMAHPDLGKEAFSSGPAILYAALERYLDAENSKGRLAIKDPPRAARILLEAFKSDFHLRAMMGVGKPANEAERAAHIDAVLDLFLRHDQGLPHPAEA